MAPLPRRSPRRRNQWNNEVPRSWGWNSGGPSWAQRPNPSPYPAPMKSGISRSVADDKSVSVCPRLFPGPGEDPGAKNTEQVRIASPSATTNSRPPMTEVVWKKSYLRKSCMGL
ncbi:hypothetical protein EYF80_016010 [Liparis tanakae]|uniref:Uncharacterized protein n=1 Tax=Liparis tanakae TaxID=230148 RepID=A0A4Z2I8U2_9TELE|nr:hypothetical protein EYF80_016010 [Liparis tanakae]